MFVYACHVLQSVIHVKWTKLLELGTGEGFPPQQQQWLFLADASVTASDASEMLWLLVVKFKFDGRLVWHSH